ncbi:glycosyltransferase family 61 protein [Methylobacterium oryzihabitans]|uniref:Glycosyltransferase family 61 protein n=1 Tax=Methylobacterium oryzihabitans TaxID=2499852 RepID=A0A437NVY4_9HYPH|nr:glycosyltransferase family 61 protein [Methylobacterium oryzihabitans]RVU14188.1 glycosyltransferase family 61 protein [Methylobacterium oryzihabitans]
MTLAAERLASCDAAILYAGAGLDAAVPERAHLMRTAPAGRLVAPLFPPYAYPRPAPEWLRGDDPVAAVALEAEFAAIDRRHPGGPPCGLFVLDDATLRDNVLHAGGRIVYETYRPPDRPGLTLAEDGDLARAEPHGAEVAFFFSSSGSFNYGHWLVDDLPRLAGFRTLRRLHPDRRITLVLTGYGAASDEIRRRTIRLFLGDAAGADTVFLPRDAAFRFPRLYYATPVSVHPASKSPEALRFVRDHLLRQAGEVRRKLAREAWRGGDPDAGRRIYVDRAPQWDRALINRDAVLDLVRARGFTVVDPEPLSFSRQVATFARARAVVGPMGAAMTSTLFCPPHATVLHLAAEGWTDPFFWDLAAALGHRYRALHGASPTPRPPPNREPYRIDLDRLDAMLPR